MILQNYAFKVSLILIYKLKVSAWKFLAQSSSEISLQFNNLSFTYNKKV